MFGRAKPIPTHSEQMLQELQEGYAHLKAAAGHVVGGTAERVTPRYDRARDLANRGLQRTPFYEAMLAGVAAARLAEAEQAKQRSTARTIAAMVTAGAAVGAVAVLLLRRRRAAEWDRYDPGQALADADAAMAGIREGGTDQTGERASSPTKKVQAGAASLAETVSSRAGRLAESLNEKSGRQGGVTGNAERTGSGEPGRAEWVAVREPGEPATGKPGNTASRPTDDMAARAHSARHSS